MTLLDIEVPIIAAVNGPAHVHVEIAILCDIVIAADMASFQDASGAWAPKSCAPKPPSA